MHQFHLDTSYEGTIYPILRSDSACLMDDGAEITLRNAHAISIVAYAMMLMAVLVDKLDETVEDGLGSRLRCLKHISVTTKLSII